MQNNGIRKIRTIIVDDEPAAREGLELLLQKDSSIDVIDVCKLGQDAVKAINESMPDLLFLDIQMPGMDGFQVLESINPQNIPIVIFVTAYDQYALKAFEVNAVDYLLKPFDDERFYKTLTKAKEYFFKSRNFEIQQKILELLKADIVPEDKLPKPKYLQRLTIKQRNETIFLDVEEIDSIEANDYYVTIYSKQRKFLMRETMNNLEKTFDPNKFIRIHRSVILNIERIISIKSYSSTENVIITKNNKTYRASKSGMKKFKQLKFH